MWYFVVSAVRIKYFLLRIKQPTRCIKYPKIYFVIKLYMFRASSVSIIRSYLLYTRQLLCFMQVMWPLRSRVRLERSSNLTLLGSGHITCMKHTNCRVYSRQLLMMGTEDAPKHVQFYDKSSNLTLLGSGHITCMKHTNCRVYSR
jgi:hypothetical protein